MANYFKSVKLSGLDIACKLYNATVEFNNIPLNKKIVKLVGADSNDWYFGGCQHARLEYKLADCQPGDYNTNQKRTENIALEVSACTCVPPNSLNHQTVFFINDSREERTMNTDDGKKK
ncbi:MAG: hypothetical protein QM503_04025 [Bacteroidota bacterium]